MASLNDIEIRGDEELVKSVTGREQVEPIGAPPLPENLMDRFPEPIYQQGRDTHLFRFIQALCGESGAGLVAKLSYYARLPQEANLLEFSDLDTLYTSHFDFRRLAFETYDDDFSTFNTQDVWDALRRKDRSYADRFALFMRACQLGGTPDGIALAAAAGIGADVDVVENYNFVYDQYSDCQLGIDQVGRSTSTSEFTLVPRLFDEDGDPIVDIDGGDMTYTSSFRNQPPDINEVVPDAAAREVLVNPIKRNLLEGMSVMSGTSAYEVGEEDEFTHLLPELEHNALQLVDRLRPVGAYMSMDPQRKRMRTVSPASDPFASSERFDLIRFVNGTSTVEWPPVQNSKGFFIEANVEKQAPHANNAIEWPIVFLTIDTAIAYDWRAKSDTTYGTSAFYTSTADAAGAARKLVWTKSPPPLAKYVSYHSGTFGNLFKKVFPSVLSDDAANNSFPPSYVIAKNNTPLVLTASRNTDTTLASPNND